MTRWNWILIIFGVILTTILTSAGMLIGYNIQNEKARLVVVCGQIGELKDDVVNYLEFQNAPDPEIDEFRPVRCPS